MNIYTNELGHMTNMAVVPIYGKNLKNLLLQYQQTNDLETWYVALPMQVLPQFSNYNPGLTWPILCQAQIWSHTLLYGKK